MAGFFNRLRGGGGSAIEADLRRITEAEAIDVPKDALMTIVQATHSVDDRGEIMKHIRGCLAESCENRWRRVYGGLVLLEQLLQRGSKTLMLEAAEGKHFDVVQRLTLLEHFSFKSDVRVQGMVRQKAAVLRGEVIQRMQDADDQAPQSFSGDDANVFDASSNGLGSNGSNEESRSPSHVLTSASSSAPPPSSDAPKAPVIINGLVSVGHRDDTSSESGAEDNSRSQVPKQQQKHRGRSAGSSSDVMVSKKSVLNDSTDSDSDSGAQSRKQNSRRQDDRAKPVNGSGNGSVQASSTTPASQTVDLLGM